MKQLQKRVPFPATPDGFKNMKGVKHRKDMCVFANCKNKAETGMPCEDCIYWWGAPK